MYAPYPENMMESIKKVEATRAQRMATEPRRLTADEKDALLKKFHPDYNPDAFAEIKVGPNKGQKAPLQLAEMLHSTSRLIKDKVDITKVDYDVDVLVIGGGGAGSSCAIEANKAGANVMIVTKLRIGDANTVMAEGGIQAADKENDSPVQHYLDCFGGGHFAAKPELCISSKNAFIPSNAASSSAPSISTRTSCPHFTQSPITAISLVTSTVFSPLLIVMELSYFFASFARILAGLA